MSACGRQGQVAGSAFGAPVSSASAASSVVSPPVSPPSSPSLTSPPSSTTGSSVAPAPKGKPAPPPGRVVVLDPGHNGGNGSHPAEINRQVPAGRGKTKPCNTTGTATNAGYPEHAFTWYVANL